MRSVYAINLCDAGDIFREQNVHFYNWSRASAVTRLVAWLLKTIQFSSYLTICAIISETAYVYVHQKIMIYLLYMFSTIARDCLYLVNVCAFLTTEIFEFYDQSVSTD